MINRLAAMQLWPLLSSRAATPVLTAASRSASSSTIKGSLPPSSSTVFFSCAPQSCATRRPAASLPVSVAARTHGCPIISATSPAPMSSAVKHMLRQPGLPENILYGKGAHGHIGSMLEHAGIARHQRGRCKAKNLPEGKIPGHDRKHHPEGIKAHIALGSIRGNNFPASIAAA